MQFVSYFSDPLPEGQDGRGMLGGKGLSLKQMTLAGLRVPPGFTIPTDCCDLYLRAGQTWPDGLEQQVRDNLTRLETESGREFGKGESPLLVSVRSGAARSMPGMMDTILNCGLHPGLAADVGDNAAFWRLWIQFILSFARTAHNLDESVFADITESGEASRQQAESCGERYLEKTGEAFPSEPWDILKACIELVFRSWNTPRAVAYRQRNGITGLRGTAVNVQMMWPSQVSGIVFTQDPAAPAEDRMIIEASYGLGEAVVSGDVTPDRYFVTRGAHREISVEEGSKGATVEAMGSTFSPSEGSLCLTEGQLDELIELALKVEDYFGYPVDIEWGLVDGSLPCSNHERSADWMLHAMSKPGAWPRSKGCEIWLRGDGRCGLHITWVRPL